MQDIIRFHVPCKLEYTSMVEDVSDLIGSHLSGGEKDAFGGKLRTVMNEVFINIVEHSNTAAQNEIVRFQFELGYKYFTISIYDYGPGFKADNYYPPYPKEIVGKRFKLREVIDGTVYFIVVDPFSISFQFVEKEDVNLEQLEEVSEIKDHGMGVSIITKIMDTVTYSYIGQGKYDWKLIKKIS